MSKTKQIVLTGLFIALGLVLPMAFHSIPNAGSIFLPMHIPVLLCGLVCGPWFGLGCGALTPLLSSVVTGMPPAAILPGMLCELAVYGLTAGLLMRFLPIANRPAHLYVSLIGAMLAGRVVSGIVNALIFRVGQYSMQIWLTASFVTALPGIAIQIVLIPIIALALQKARLAELPA